MAITTSDLKFKLSTKSGTAGNTTAGTPDGSLGKWISTTEISSGTLNNLFDNITGDENAAEDVEYRCIFIHNAHSTLTLENAVAWISAEVTGGASVQIAIDSKAASAVGSSTAQAAEIADEGTAPTGVGTFSAPTTKATGLSLGNIAAGYCRAIWIKRTANNTVAVNNDGFTLRVEGDTAA